jgi:hypothetical protein
MSDRKPLGMVHAARMMRRYRVQPNRSRTAPQPPPQEAPPDSLAPSQYRRVAQNPEAQTPRPNDVKVLPDSWHSAPPAQAKTSRKQPPRPLGDQILDAQIAQLGLQKKHSEGVRRALAERAPRTAKSVSLSMTSIEEQALREHAKSLNMTFSKWARVILFTAAGVPIPDDVNRGGWRGKK